jgi:hypothetical protein
MVYYYTYGSVLAALSRPADNKCGDAMQVFREVRAELNANPEAYSDSVSTVLSIVQAGEAICASLGEENTAPVPTGTPGGGGEAGVTSTPTP